jgi:hypothetical protein
MALSIIRVPLVSATCRKQASEDAVMVFSDR